MGPRHPHHNSLVVWGYGAILAASSELALPGLARFDQSIATRRTSCVPGLSWEWSLCRCVVVVVSHFPYGYVAADIFNSMRL